MKTLSTILLLLISVNAFGQVNREITGYYGENILVGKIDRSGLQQEPYSEWFDFYYDNYEVDEASLGLLYPYLDGLEVTIFLGTWCSDSQMQVPQFLKMMDYLGVSDEVISMYGVTNDPDHYLTIPGGEKGFGISAVPTFIFYQNGFELGRIVEYPEATLEKDMVRILVTGGI